MTKQISQNTFNEVVQENIEVFEMQLKESIADAKTQFEAQGVNLYNIIIDEGMYEVENGEVRIKKHPITSHSEILKTLISNDKFEDNQIETSLKTLNDYFNKDISYRMMGAKYGFSDIIVKITEYCIKAENHKILEITLTTTVNYFFGQPDEAKNDILSNLVSIIKHDTLSADVKARAFKALSVSCLKNERNRDILVNDPYQMIYLMFEVLEKTDVEHRELIKEICCFCRILTLDDDVRVTCGQGTEHAKNIVKETSCLDTLLKLCKTYKAEEDEYTLSEIFATLDKLSVRNEFCQRILDLGGLNHILETLKNHFEKEKIVVASLGLLKSLAANDTVKMEIGKHPIGMEIILRAISRNVRHVNCCVNGCGALAAITLRQIENSQKVVNLGIVPLVYEILQIHVKTKSYEVLRPACLIIRNIVSRNKDICSAFNEMDFESLLNEVLALGRNCDDEAKAALRDLGLAVELKELWTGKDGEIKND